MPFFADTNICSKWESDPDVNHKWETLKSRLESDGQKYVACPLVLIELLGRLIKPEPQYFSKDLKSFMFLSNEEEQFLPFPGDFVVNAVFGVHSPVTALHPSDFRQMLQCVLRADSRESLAKGEVEIPGSTLFTYGLNFDDVKVPHENGKRTHVAMLEHWRKVKYIPRREQHARNFLRSQTILPKNGDVEAVADALEAAYQYDLFLLNEVDLKYDYAKHSSDWVDKQLLYYLADPNMYVVTNDTKLKHRCRRSKQADRVIVI